MFLKKMPPGVPLRASTNSPGHRSGALALTIDQVIAYRGLSVLRDSCQLVPKTSLSLFLV
jgi:hypothetical protein